MKISGNWTFNDLDKKIAEGISLPEKIFDGHAHIWRNADWQYASQSVFTEGPEQAGIEIWHEYIEKQVGKSRLIGGLFLGLPMCDMDKMNDFLVEQLKNRPESRGLINISPDYSKEKTLEYIKNPSIAGFKPYHTKSMEKPTFQSSISGFLPEWCLKIADDQGLIITLHIVKDLALSDPDNQREIRRICLQYPNLKLILAHAGRGFHASNTVNGVSSLKGLQNVWFDTSAICEPAPIVAVLREFGPLKLLWGSDFCASELRGKCVSAGDGFVWLTEDTVKWNKLSPSCNPTLVGLESISALMEASEYFCLNNEDLQNIFCDNARRLLGLIKEPGTVTKNLYEHAKEIIPGGTQLLSKRPEMFAPGQWPAYFREARGCEVWDLDGRHYYDFSINGVGSCLLGFRDPDVTRAVKRRINLGSMSTLNPPEEIELADLLLEIHPWAGQVRYARTGGESMTAAVRIARATTDRSVIAVCGYSGWHDWYLAANLGEDDSLRGHLLPGLEPLGVPGELRGTITTFRYNRTDDFKAVIDQFGERLAAVVMEPCRSCDPEPGFLEYVRDQAHKAGALLVFDEITIGWRLYTGGAHLKFGINPDIAVFAKALGNGHPMAAIIGTSEAMEGAHSTFISSTYWTECVGPAAALATVRKMMRIDVPAHVAEKGNMVLKYWKEYAEKHSLPVVTGDGYPCISHFHFDHELCEELRTLYTQLMLKRGLLAGPAIYVTLAHTDEIIERYGTAIDEVFSEIAEILHTGEVKKRLKGPVAHKGFARLT